MPLPIRKRNRLSGYDYSREGAYFITVCTKDKAPILGTIGATTPVGADAHIGPQASTPNGTDDYIGPQVFLSPIGKIVHHYLQTVPGLDRYIIMPNHVHFILCLSDENWQEDGPMRASAPTGTAVSSLVRSWKILTSKAAGRSLWQRSFYDRIIRDEREYLASAKYIEENPWGWYRDEYYINPL